MMYSVIMAGGRGTRFWPASRRQRPKQLLTLFGQRSLLQRTVDRMAPLTPPERVVVVTAADHAEALAEQIPQVPAKNILVEPEGRNTAAAAGLAAAWVARRDPSAVCLVLPADHLIDDEGLFLSTFERAAEAAAAQDALITMGLKPTFAATGYGYIEIGPVLEPGPPALHQVAAFHEKPEPAVAESYLAGGRHLWNSGMFAWRAEVLLKEIEVHLPSLAEGLAGLAEDLGTERQEGTLARHYPRLPAISVDYGVLEKTKNIRVVAAEFGWSDVGSWEAMAELWDCDGQGNACHQGEIVGHDAKDNLVSAGGRLAVLLGVDNQVVVVTDDVVLVMDRSRGQELGEILKTIKDSGLDDHL